MGGLAGGVSLHHDAVEDAAEEGLVEDEVEGALAPDFGAAGRRGEERGESGVR